MSVTSRGITYANLRRIVTALFEIGVSLKDETLTFSHGNIGNEYMDLSRYLDAFVRDLEPRDDLLLLKADVISAKEASCEARIQMAFEPLRHLQKVFGALSNQELIEKVAASLTLLSRANERNAQLHILLEEANQTLRKITADMTAMADHFEKRKVRKKRKGKRAVQTS